MLARLSIRDVVLIEQLDLAFAPGFAVLTGETGAGKSILLDALGLALGRARRRRAGARRAPSRRVVAAEFDARRTIIRRTRCCAEPGIGADGRCILRRAGRRRRPQPRLRQRPAGQRRRCCASSATRWSRSRASSSSAACSIPATHRALLDAFAGTRARRPPPGAACARLARARERRGEADAALRRRRSAEEDYLRHAVAELEALDARGRRGERARPTERQLLHEPRAARSRR